MTFRQCSPVTLPPEIYGQLVSVCSVSLRLREQDGGQDLGEVCDSTVEQIASGSATSTQSVSF